jgi:hypothetical protein
VLHFYNYSVYSQEKAMELDFDRLNKMGVFLLPCPFESNSYTVIIKENGNRKGRVRPMGKEWEAVNQTGSKGKKKKLEDAVKLLL